MAEGIAHSAKNADEQVIKGAEAVSGRSAAEEKQAQATTNGAGVTWTPRFIVIFALILIVGLSTASVVTQGWTNRYYSSGPVLMLYLIPILVCWIVLFRHAHSRWLRWGVVFGYLWTLLSALYYRLNYGFIDPHAPVTLHLQVAVYSALALTYICISLAHIPRNRWDTWFFRLAPVILCLFFLFQLFLRFAFGRISAGIEPTIFSEIVYFCVLVWWARPSCWKRQPGPTLLFGLVPFLQIALTFSPMITEDIKFFFTQIALLAILLGVLRLLQCELHH